MHAYRYTYQNPVAAGLCERPEEYAWSTLSFLLGQTKSIIPVAEDATLFSNIDGTLEWLNTRYNKEQSVWIKQALNKKIFKLPQNPKLKKVDPDFERSIESLNAPGSGMLAGADWWT